MGLLDRFFRRSAPAATVQNRADRDQDPADPHIQPVARPDRLWTPEGLEAALLEADAGQLMRAADLCESLMCDPQIRSVLDQRVLGLQGLPLTFSGERNADAERLWWGMLPPSELARIHRWGIMLGVSPVRWVLPDRANADGTYYPTADQWHPRFLRQETYSERWTIQTRDNGLIYLDEYSDEWTLYRPFGNRRPWAEGYWRAVAFAWLLKRFALADRARHSEVNGTPIRKGTAPQGATDGQRSKWRRILAEMGRDSAVVLPAGWDLDLVETTGQGAALYEAQIEWADKAFAKVLTGAPILSEGSNMGFGEGTVFASIKRDLIRFDALTLRDCLGPDVDYWIDQNFGQGRYSFAWNTTPPDEQLKIAETIVKTAEAIRTANSELVGTGLAVDAASIFQHLGLPLIQARVTTSAIDRSLLEFGIITINEARAISGHGPIDGGDTRPRPLAPLDPAQDPDSGTVLLPPAEPPAAPPPALPSKSGVRDA